MARVNRTPRPIVTHEGAVAKTVSPEQQLRRSVLACLLWESSFYEDGVSVAERIAGLVPKVAPATVSALAIEAREQMKLRHVPLLLVREMSRHSEHKSLVATTLSRVIQRADELAEFVQIYWLDKKQPLSAQVKKGLALAFPKFTEYELAKYNRPNAVKLRDVLFLCHAKPKDKEQEAVWKKLIDGSLTTPDTWEVALSGGADKKEAFERLMTERKLGALALLRNLRNMVNAGCDPDIVENAIRSVNVERIFPYRFISAATHAPRYESVLENKMFECLGHYDKLPGRTVLLMDVSGSMGWPISDKSTLNRIEAACGLAILAREVCESVRVVTFSEKVVEVPPRRGFGLKDVILKSQDHRGTYLGSAVKFVLADVKPDRLIVFTDEQSHDAVPDPIGVGKAYMVNVASYQNGVGYHSWVHMDGWSEAVLRYISEYEKQGF